MSAPGSSPFLLADEASSILLVRLRSIGDAILATPLAEAIKRERPRARVVALLEQPAAALFSRHPHLDGVIVAARGATGRMRTLARLRRERFDVALDLHGGPTAALLTRFCGARLRVGLAAYRARGAYDVRLESPFKGADGSVTLHTIESNLAIARALGLDPPATLRPTLVPSREGEAEAETALRAAAFPTGVSFVAVHPGAHLRSKRWPRERFAAVAASLARDGVRVAFLTAPEDGSPAGAGSSGLGAIAGAALIPPLSLPGLLSLLRRAALFVGNDSGPAHMAAACGVPTVTLFGSQDPRVWRPLEAGAGPACVGPRHSALWKGLPCSPCRGLTCANLDAPFACLDRIAVDEVLGAARTLLARA